MSRRDLSLPSAAEADLLSGLFREARYNETSINDRIGVIHSALERQSERMSRLESVPPNSLLNLLIRWFVLSEPVDGAVAERFAGPEFVEICLRRGLLEKAKERLMATILIIPQGDLLIGGDRYDTPVEIVGEPVLPVNAPARSLLGFTVDGAVASLLDLCAGGGVQALAGASRSRLVVATDMNPRAVLFAELNCRLNGLDNVECLHGDRFDPVAGRQFDQIVCNPPFVISPSKRFLYSDNDAALDDFCRGLVESAPAHLNEGGIFQMILEWVQIEGEDWKERLGGWVEGSGCDVWILSFNLTLPETNARMHATTMAAQTPVDVLVLQEEMAAYLRDQHVEAVHGGFVMMRKRTEPNWLSFSEVRSELPEELGSDWVVDGFRARDFLHGHPAEADLLAIRPTLRPGVTIDQSTEWDGAWRRQPVKLRTTRGLPFSLNLDDDVVEFVSRCTGEHSVSELCRRLQSKVEEPLAEVERECCLLVRRLIELGVLDPPAEG